MMRGRASKQYIFRSYKTYTFNAMRFDENPFTCQCKRENKKDSGFQISHFYGSFSSEVRAVKGLKRLSQPLSSWRIAENLCPKCRDNLLMNASSQKVCVYSYLKKRKRKEKKCTPGSCYVILPSSPHTIYFK